MANTISEKDPQAVVVFLSHMASQNSDLPVAIMGTQVVSYFGECHLEGRLATHGSR